MTGKGKSWLLLLESTTMEHKRYENKKQKNRVHFYIIIMKENE